MQSIEDKPKRIIRRRPVTQAVNEDKRSEKEIMKEMGFKTMKAYRKFQKKKRREEKDNA